MIRGANALAVLAIILATGSLILTLLLARRMRLLQQQLHRGPYGEDLPAAGTPVPGVQARDTDGRPLTTEDLREPELLVAFLTASCDPCWDEVPRLREVAAASRRPPVVVVIGDQRDRTRFVDALTPVTRIIEQEDHSIAVDFGVRGFPAFVVVGDGVVRQSGHDLAELGLGVPA